jgi:hypothetical protein
MPQLPIEIILQVIDNVIDFEDRWHPPVALPPSDIRTQTLYAFLTVCRPVHFTAKRYLYQYCLFIASPRQLESLHSSLMQHHPQSIVRHIHSFYLAPFPEKEIEPKFEGLSYPDSSIANAIWDLLHLLAPTLTRLVIDMPLRPSGIESGTVQATLRSAFSQLVNLQELASTHDTVNGVGGESWAIGDLWSSCYQLRKLALYNPLIDPTFLDQILSLPHLNKLVLTKKCFRRMRPHANLFRKEYDEMQKLQLIVMTEHYHNSSRIHRAEKQFRGQVELVQVVLPFHSCFRMSPGESTQVTLAGDIRQQVKFAAVRGDLWTGEIIDARWRQASRAFRSMRRL